MIVRLPVQPLLMLLLVPMLIPSVAAEKRNTDTTAADHGVVEGRSLLFASEGMGKIVILKADGSERALSAHA